MGWITQEGLPVSLPEQVFGGAFRFLNRSQWGITGNNFFQSLPITGMNTVHEPVRSFRNPLRVRDQHLTGKPPENGQKDQQTKQQPRCEP